MTKNIIEMAKEAGIRYETIEFYQQELTAFANLVAAKEREACAEVCDELHWPWRIGDNSGPKQCAIAIRARGEQA